MASWVPYITGSGGALVVLAIGLYLIITGKLHTDGEFQGVVAENKELKDESHDLRAALEIERTTNNELARSGGVAAKALDALVEVATGRHEHDQAALDSQRGAAREVAGLTPEDLGLLCDGRGGATCGRSSPWSGSTARPRYPGNGRRRPVSRSSGRSSGGTRRTTSPN